jgi:hypothetical protein
MMQKKWFILCLMGILAVSMMAFVGCSDDDDDVVAPATLKPGVHGMVFGSSGGPRKDAGDPAAAYVTVANATVVPECTVNGVTLELEPEMSMYSGGMGHYGAFELAADNAVTVAVDLGGDRGTGSVSLTMPGEFDIVGNSMVYPTPGASETFDWTASADAEIYWVRADFEIRYVNNDGLSLYWENEWSLFTTDTEVTFTAAQMFPDPADVDHITSIWGDLDVMSVAGPIQAGDLSNVSGACTGFVVAIGNEIDWDMDDGPILKTDEREHEYDLLADYVQLMR